MSNPSAAILKSLGLIGLPLKPSDPPLVVPPIQSISLQQIYLDYIHQEPNSTDVSLALRRGIEITATVIPEPTISLRQFIASFMKAIASVLEARGYQQISEQMRLKQNYERIIGDIARRIQKFQNDSMRQIDAINRFLRIMPGMASTLPSASDLSGYDFINPGVTRSEIAIALASIGAALPIEIVDPKNSDRTSEQYIKRLDKLVTELYSRLIKDALFKISTDGRDAGQGLLDALKEMLLSRVGMSGDPAQLTTGSYIDGIYAAIKRVESGWQNLTTAILNAQSSWSDSTDPTKFAQFQGIDAILKALQLTSSDLSSYITDVAQAIVDAGHMEAKADTYAVLSSGRLTGGDAQRISDDFNAIANCFTSIPGSGSYDNYSDAQSVQVAPINELEGSLLPGTFYYNPENNLFYQVSRPIYKVSSNSAVAAWDPSKSYQAYSLAYYPNSTGQGPYFLCVNPAGSRSGELPSASPSWLDLGKVPGSSAIEWSPSQTYAPATLVRGSDGGYYLSTYTGKIWNGSAFVDAGLIGCDPSTHPDHWRALGTQIEAAEWCSGGNYQLGQIVSRAGNSYLCIEPIAAATTAPEAINSKSWLNLGSLGQVANLTGQLPAWSSAASYRLGDLVKTDQGECYICIDASGSSGSLGNEPIKTQEGIYWHNLGSSFNNTPFWSNTTSYSTYSLVRKGTNYYLSLQDQNLQDPQLDFNRRDWACLGDLSQGTPPAWDAATAYLRHQLVQQNGNFYVCVIEGGSTGYNPTNNALSHPLSGSDPATVQVNESTVQTGQPVYWKNVTQLFSLPLNYDSSSTYPLGSIVRKDGECYVRTGDSSIDWNENDWTLCAVAEPYNPSHSYSFFDRVYDLNGTIYESIKSGELTSAAPPLDDTSAWRPIEYSDPIFFSLHASYPFQMGVMQRALSQQLQNLAQSLRSYQGSFSNTQAYHAGELVYSLDAFGGSSYYHALMPIIQSGEFKATGLRGEGYSEGEVFTLLRDNSSGDRDYYITKPGVTGYQPIRYGTRSMRDYALSELVNDRGRLWTRSATPSPAPLSAVANSFHVGDRLDLAGQFYSVKNGFNYLGDRTSDFTAYPVDYAVGDALEYNGLFYIFNNQLPLYQPGKSYTQDQYVRDGGKIYQCIKDTQSSHLPGSAPSAWQEIAVGDFIVGSGQIEPLGYQLLGSFSDGQVKAEAFLKGGYLPGMAFYDQDGEGSSTYYTFEPGNSLPAYSASASYQLGDYVLNSEGTICQAVWDATGRSAFVWQPVDDRTYCKTMLSSRTDLDSDYLSDLSKPGSSAYWNELSYKQYIASDLAKGEGSHFTLYDNPLKGFFKYDEELSHRITRQRNDVKQLGITLSNYLGGYVASFAPYLNYSGQQLVYEAGRSYQLKEGFQITQCGEFDLSQQYGTGQVFTCDNLSYIALRNEVAPSPFTLDSEYRPGDQVVEQGQLWQRTQDPTPGPLDPREAYAAGDRFSLGHNYFEVRPGMQIAPTGEPYLDQLSSAFNPVVTGCQPHQVFASDGVWYIANQASSPVPIYDPQQSYQVDAYVRSATDPNQRHGPSIYSPDQIWRKLDGAGFPPTWVCVSQASYLTGSGQFELFSLEEASLNYRGVASFPGQAPIASSSLKQVDLTGSFSKGDLVRLNEQDYMAIGPVDPSSYVSRQLYPLGSFVEYGGQIWQLYQPLLDISLPSTPGTVQGDSYWLQVDPATYLAQSGCFAPVSTLAGSVQSGSSLDLSSDYALGETFAVGDFVYLVEASLPGLTSYKPSASYLQGDRVTYAGAIWTRSNLSFPSGLSQSPDDSSGYWERTSLGSYLASCPISVIYTATGATSSNIPFDPSYAYSVGSTFQQGDSCYVTTYETQAVSSYSPSHSYSKGDYVQYQGRLWKCINPQFVGKITQAPSNSSINWQSLTVEEYIRESGYFAPLTRRSSAALLDISSPTQSPFWQLIDASTWVLAHSIAAYDPSFTYSNWSDPDSHDYYVTDRVGKLWKLTQAIPPGTSGRLQAPGDSSPYWSYQPSWDSTLPPLARYQAPLEAFFAESSQPIQTYAPGKGSMWQADLLSQINNVEGFVNSIRSKMQIFANRLVSSKSTSDLSSAYNLFIATVTGSDVRHLLGINPPNVAGSYSQMENLAQQLQQLATPSAGAPPTGRTIIASYLLSVVQASLALSSRGFGGEPATLDLSSIDAAVEAVAALIGYISNDNEGLSSTLQEVVKALQSIVEGTHFLPLGSYQSHAIDALMRLASDLDLLKSMPSGDPWQQNLDYAKYAVVSYENNYYVCLSSVGSKGQAPNLDADLWKLVPGCLWNASRTYQAGELVQGGDGNYYVAIGGLASQSQDPTQAGGSSYWQSIGALPSQDAANRPVWQQGSNYARYAVVFYEGHYYVRISSEAEGAGVPSSSPSDWVQVPDAYWWQASGSYKLGDLVQGSDGNYYIWISSSQTSVAPDPTAADSAIYWRKLGVIPASGTDSANLQLASHYYNLSNDLEALIGTLGYRNDASGARYDWILTNDEADQTLKALRYVFDVLRVRSPFAFNYSDTTGYKEYSVVTHPNDKKLYICTSPTMIQGRAPAEGSSYWKLVASPSDGSKALNQIPIWSSKGTYSKYSVVRGSDDKYYASCIDQNRGKSPIDDQEGFWQPLGSSSSELYYEYAQHMYEKLGSDYWAQQRDLALGGFGTTPLAEGAQPGLLYQLSQAYSQLKKGVRLASEDTYTVCTVNSNDLHFLNWDQMTSYRQQFINYRSTIVELFNEIDSAITRVDFTGTLVKASQNSFNQLLAAMSKEQPLAWTAGQQYAAYTVVHCPEEGKESYYLSLKRTSQTPSDTATDWKKLGSDAFDLPLWRAQLPYLPSSLVLGPDGNYYLSPLNLVQSYPSSSAPQDSWYQLSPTAMAQAAHWVSGTYYQPYQVVREQVSGTYQYYIALKQTQERPSLSSDWKLIGSGLFALPAWDSKASYGAGDSVIGSDGNYYVALIEHPTSDPTASSSSAQWKKLGVSLSPSLADAFAYFINNLLVPHQQVLIGDLQVGSLDQLAPSSPSLLLTSYQLLQEWQLALSETMTRYDRYNTDRGALARAVYNLVSSLLECCQCQEGVVAPRLSLALSLKKVETHLRQLQALRISTRVSPILAAGQGSVKPGSNDLKYDTYYSADNYTELTDGSGGPFSTGGPFPTPKISLGLFHDQAFTPFPDTSFSTKGVPSNIVYNFYQDEAGGSIPWNDQPFSPYAGVTNPGPFYLFFAGDVQGNTLQFYQYDTNKHRLSNTPIKHGFVDGQQVIFDDCNQGRSSLGELQTFQPSSSSLHGQVRPYYVIVVDDTSIQLAESAENVVKKEAVNLSAGSQPSYTPYVLRGNFVSYSSSTSTAAMSLLQIIAQLQNFFSKTHGMYNHGAGGTDYIAGATGTPEMFARWGWLDGRFRAIAYNYYVDDDRLDQVFNNWHNVTMNSDPVGRAMVATFNDAYYGAKAFYERVVAQLQNYQSSFNDYHSAVERTVVRWVTQAFATTAPAEDMMYKTFEADALSPEERRLAAKILNLLITILVAMLGSNPQIHDVVMQLAAGRITLQQLELNLRIPVRLANNLIQRAAAMAAEMINRERSNKNNSADFVASNPVSAQSLYDLASFYQLNKEEIKGTARQHQNARNER